MQYARRISEKEEEKLKNEDISALKKKYPGQWLLVKVTKEDEQGNPVKGTLIYHHKNKDQVIDKSKQRNEDIALFHSGPIPKKGYAFCFLTIPVVTCIKKTKANITDSCCRCKCGDFIIDQQGSHQG